MSFVFLNYCFFGMAIFTYSLAAFIHLCSWESSCVVDDVINMTKTDFLTQQLNKKPFVGCNIFTGKVHISLTISQFDPASLFPS